MVRVVAVRHGARERELVQRLVAEADGVGLQPAAQLFRHQRGDDAGIEPTGEVRAQRHVGHQPLAHRAGEQLAHPLTVERLAEVLAPVGEIEVPVALDARLAPFGDEVVPRFQRVDAFEHRQRRDGVAEREVADDRLQVRLRVDQPAGEDRLRLRGEEQQVAGPRVQQRLDAEPVTGEQQPRAPRVPHAEREHPVEVREQRRRVAVAFLVAVHQHLGVGLGAETVAAAQQRLAQVEVVVDLSVEREPDALVLVRHWLPAGLRQIDDRQPSMAQRARAAGPVTEVVGAAVLDRGRHALDGAVRHGAAIERDDPGDSTHVTAPPCARPGRTGPQFIRRGYSRNG